MTNKPKHTKRSIGIMIGLTLVALVGIGLIAFGEQSISMTETEVKQKLAEQMPVIKQGKVLLQDYEVEINQLEIDFQSDGNIFIEVKPLVNTSLGGADLDITAVGEVVLKGSSFYFLANDFTFESFNFDSVAQAKTKVLGKLVENFANRHKDLLKGTNVDVSSGENQERIKSAIKTKTEAVIVQTLQNHPVYTLDGAAGTFIALGVTGIEVTDNDVTVRISLLKLSLSVILFLLATVAMLGALLTLPAWGGGLLMAGAFFGP